MKRLCLVLLLLLALSAGCQRAPASEAGPREIKNVVLMIGDGMGMASITAARVLAGERQGIDPPESAKLFIDTMPYTGLVRTYAANARVTDSASSMTAMMTGEKCQNYVVSLDATTDQGDEAGDGDGLPLRTALEIAESMGKATGVISTTRITHATPAACYAHINDRGREQEIADQLLDNPALGDGVEVLLGGGRQNFVPVRDASGKRMFDEEGERGARRDQTDLRERFKERGYTYVHDADGFAAIDPASTERLLGLFDASHMEYEIDRAKDSHGEPSIAEMATKTIELLSRDADGFFLVIEGGRIDHALHVGQALRSITDLLAFDDAVKAVVESVDLDQTLVIVVPDHDHTMVIAGYPGLGSPAIAPGGVDQDKIGYMSLLFGTGPGFQAERQVPPETASEDPDYEHQSAVRMRISTHGGMDVPLYAIGASPYAARFTGSHENTFIFDMMVSAMEGR